VEHPYSLDELLAQKITESAISDHSLKERFSQNPMRGRIGDIVVAYTSGVHGADPSDALHHGTCGLYNHDTVVPIILWCRGANRRPAYCQ
jgi:hypothetical protein